MYLIPYLGCILLIGGSIAWAFGAEVHDIVYWCGLIACGCFYLFLMGCVWAFMFLLTTPSWAVATPIILTALFALAVWNRYR
ncbi:MAG TPA: hypothetical protein VM490_22855 [Armatimonadaceae bacterium]|nr:hypothetical protein [Armatimonadaceae bacterium]